MSSDPHSPIFTGPESRPTFIPATFALIGISVLVAVLSHLGKKDAVLEHFFITNFLAAGRDVELPEIAHGEFWRLLTPIFIHFGALHLIFNMMWTRDLGSVIERREGTRAFLILVAVLGVCSNLGQLFVSGPHFGGMSGVVYGLLGYVWMKSRFDPASGYVLHNQTVILMIGWFFACVAGLVGNVANTAHGVGLVLGMIWGFAAARQRPPAGTIEILR
jgi:membrane associated rhomboid family serine protease